MTVNEALNLHELSLRGDRNKLNEPSQITFSTHHSKSLFDVLFFNYKNSDQTEIPTDHTDQHGMTLLQR